MKTVTLSTALTGAAKKTYSKFRTLDTPDARSAFCEEFLQRWLILSADPLTLEPTAASGSYFFLLWKNLSVTNISVIELAALLRIHSKSRKTGRRLQVDFLTTEDYKTFLNNLWQSVFSPGRPNKITGRIERAVQDIIAFHANFFERTVIFDTYFTSVLVFIPRTIKVNIGAVTTESGYVHSAGIAIYFRNIEKASRELFRYRMRRFLKMQGNKKFFITPYAFELFAPYEGRSSVSIRNGLDGVRIQLRKHYFESESLPDFLVRLKAQFPKRLLIPLATGSYDDNRKKSLAAGAEPDISIWFVTDAGVRFDTRERVADKSKDLFIITYAQTHLNHSQFNIFKERKPAWISSTTLPHSLSAAMINIARHHLELNSEESVRSKKKVVLDPFCGTGTTLFDAVTRIPNAVVLGLDNSPIMPVLVKNNAKFFATPNGDIASALDALKSVQSYINQKIKADDHDPSVINNTMQDIRVGKGVIKVRRTTVQQELEYCIFVLMDEMGLGGADISDASVVRLSQQGFSKGLLSKIESKDFSLETKIILFALWRSLLMNTFSMRPEAITARGVFLIFLDEIERCIKEYGDLKRLLGRNSHSCRARLTKQKTWNTCIGTYSLEGRINPRFFSGRGEPILCESREFDADQIPTWKPGTYISRVGDSLEALAGKKPFADIIISDPPFGFNEFDSGSQQIRELYAKMIPRLLDVLLPWGQLIISLPAFAKNGKQIPFYQTRESVTKQVIAHVEAADRKVVRNIESFPADREIFDLPWYWGTASTIERRVIHFVVK